MVLAPRFSHSYGFDVLAGGVRLLGGNGKEVPSVFSAPAFSWNKLI